MQRFTREDLARYHGQDGAPAYVAFKGKVYDASRNFLWWQGRHQVRHSAAAATPNGPRRHLTERV